MRNFTFTRSISSIISIVIIFGMANNFAVAQDGISIEEITVTARQREESLADAPYTISAIIILGTAMIRYLDSSPEVFAVIPEYLKLPTYVFTISNFVMCIQSIRMAFFHRRYDLTARNAFLGVAVSSMFSGFYYLWTSPFGEF